MSCSKLSITDDPDKLREKKDKRNRKKREKFAALSVEEKQAQRKKKQRSLSQKKIGENTFQVLATTISRSFSITSFCICYP